MTPKDRSLRQLLQGQDFVCATARILDHQMNEVQLGDRRCRQYERIEIRLAHAARQFVEHARQLDPRSDE